MAELKRDADRDVHLQAVTYAALVSRFEISTLAAAHAKFLSARGTPTTAEQARKALLDHSRASGTLTCCGSQPSCWWRQRSRAS